MQFSWPAVLTALLGGEELPAEATRWAMGEIMDGAATPAQVAGFAVALRAKGESADEIAGLVEGMLDRAVGLALPPGLRRRVVDTCGTGGDRAHTVNISTMAAVVTAAAGVPVVKHGNRAASSACGSADLLEALGVVIDLDASRVAHCIDTVGIGFCFAPLFHPALRHAAVARRELGVPTVFNVLGPLTNPARPLAQAVGVADGRLAPVMADVLAARGASALVFRGEDGLDELTPTGPSTVWAVGQAGVRCERVDPRELDVPAVEHDELRGGDATHNAEVTLAVLGGRERGGIRHAVLLNAAAALVAADGVSDEPVVDQLRPAVDRAAEAIDSGAAKDVLRRWITASRS